MRDAHGSSAALVAQPTITIASVLRPRCVRLQVTLFERDDSAGSRDQGYVLGLNDAGVRVLEAIVAAGAPRSGNGAEGGAPPAASSGGAGAAAAPAAAGVLRMLRSVANFSACFRDLPPQCSRRYRDCIGAFAS